MNKLMATKLKTTYSIFYLDYGRRDNYRELIEPNISGSWYSAKSSGFETYEQALEELTRKDDYGYGGEMLDVFENGEYVILPVITKGN